MLQETDNTVAPAASANPHTGEAKEVSVASSSALLFDFFDAREQSQLHTMLHAEKRKGHRKLSI